MQTTDPGRALITGKWADIGKFKGPILRGLAARAPYFHNGFAATLDDVVDFYDTASTSGSPRRSKPTWSPSCEDYDCRTISRYRRGYEL